MTALIAYFSRADENYFGGTLKKIKVGNTEKIAAMIQNITGADMFKIEPIVSYSEDYNECTSQAQDDKCRNARPALKEYLDSLNNYDEIYLGFPNYWGTMPMPVFTFLEHYDFNGKKIYPFCTHEGSKAGESIKDLKRICPNAIIMKELTVYGSLADDAGVDVKKWLGAK